MNICTWQRGFVQLVDFEIEQLPVFIRRAPASHTPLGERQKLERKYQEWYSMRCSSVHFSSWTWTAKLRVGSGSWKRRGSGYNPFFPFLLFNWFFLSFTSCAPIPLISPSLISALCPCKTPCSPSTWEAERKIRSSRWLIFSYMKPYLSKQTTNKPTQNSKQQQQTAKRHLCLDLALCLLPVAAVIRCHNIILLFWKSETYPWRYVP